MSKIQAKMVVNLNCVEWTNDEEYNKKIRQFYVITITEKMREQNPDINISVVPIQTNDKMFLYIFEDNFDVKEEVRQNLVNLYTNLQDHYSENKILVSVRKEIGDKKLIDRTDTKISSALMEIILGISNHHKSSYDKGMKKLIKYNSIFLEEYDDMQEKGKQEKLYIYKEKGAKCYKSNEEFTYMELCESMQKNINVYTNMVKDLVNELDWWNVEVMDMNPDFIRCFNVCNTEFCMNEWNKIKK
tara:strand:+ start:442 stop:1173 length:732 start_codon:yes stop_codon:yes gene_type:complete